MSRYRQIILHAGLSKTGTTSIQDNCEKYRVFLHERGIVYPQFSYGDEPFVTHSIPFTAAITGRPGKYGLMLRERFQADVDEVIRNCKEQLDRILETAQGDTLLLSTGLIEGFDEKDMATLRAYLLPRAEQFRVVAYMRSPQSGLESLLQERIKMGGLPDPGALIGRIRQKYENLHKSFPDALEIINFHDAIRHPHGLVGSFLVLAGLPEEEMAGLEFVSRNERLSMEAFSLMWAINQRYPSRDQKIHGVPRQPRDLDVLERLPGPPFYLSDFMSSGLHQACLEEALWLESRLGLQFPHEPRQQPEPLWQDQTLAVLEQTVRALHSVPIVQFVADFLRDEAQKCNISWPATALGLERISENLLSDDPG
jgi:hypothetical protein